MDSRLLEYFLRVAELGSINKASADLQLSQPALSRHIAALEHELGTRLFTRTQGGVVLTEGGKLLADRARPLLRQFAMVKEQVGEMAAGQLSIGIPPSWQHVFTSPFVERMVAEVPGVTLRVHRFRFLRGPRRAQPHTLIRLPARSQAFTGTASVSL